MIINWKWEKTSKNQFSRKDDSFALGQVEFYGPVVIQLDYVQKTAPERGQYLRVVSTEVVGVDEVE